MMRLHSCVAVLESVCSAYSTMMDLRDVSKSCMNDESKQFSMNFSLRSEHLRVHLNAC